MKCKHKNADHLMRGQWFIDWEGDLVSIAMCEQLRCLMCGAWMSLGPSADDDERVKIEIQAAYFVAEPESLAAARWFDCPFGECAGCERDRHAGHLARVIAETSGGGGGT